MGTCNGQDNMAVSTTGDPFAAKHDRRSYLLVGAVVDFELPALRAAIARTTIVNVSSPSTATAGEAGSAAVTNSFSRAGIWHPEAQPPGTTIEDRKSR